MGENTKSIDVSTKISSKHTIKYKPILLTQLLGWALKMLIFCPPTFPASNESRKSAWWRLKNFPSAFHILLRIGETSSVIRSTVLPHFACDNVLCLIPVGDPAGRCVERWPFLSLYTEIRLGKPGCDKPYLRQDTPTRAIRPDEVGILAIVNDLSHIWFPLTALTKGRTLTASHHH